MTSRKSLRIICAVAFALMFALPAAAVFGSTGDAQAQSYSGINIEFVRPAYAGKSQVVECTIRLSGGPAGDLGGNFTKCKFSPNLFIRTTGFRKSIPG